MLGNRKLQKKPANEGQAAGFIEDHEEDSRQWQKDDGESIEASGQAIGPLTVVDDELLSEASPGTAGKNFDSINQTLASLDNTRVMSGLEENQEELDQLTRKNSIETTYEKLAG